MTGESMMIRENMMIGEKMKTGEILKIGKVMINIKMVVNRTKTKALTNMTLIKKDHNEFKFELEEEIEEIILPDLLVIEKLTVT
eukprot:CAMPEP_0116884506 /NCGR_PEP_ID=MMETSP0463-20121206/17435_1 /TAXON_ID=181622 /ORGANISM="Strombidinopsis sp, Strain SopsisLIS2011" /LENGTH=83 /DNA_ID=CAMNT_0004541153 /DNA_START=379 /DNA_END=631 /DNA_ORIENTATION=+